MTEKRWVSGVVSIATGIPQEEMDQNFPLAKKKAGENLALFLNHFQILPGEFTILALNLDHGVMFYYLLIYTHHDLYSLHSYRNAVVTALFD